MSKRKKVLSWEEKYKIIDESIGAGGNGNVLLVEDRNTQEQFALKVLREGGAEKRTRFIEEINIMKDNWQLIDGIMPIYDYSLEEYWYTMPLATPITVYIKERDLDIEGIINLSIQLAEVLEKLHNKGIPHRDIKPSNIYFWNGRGYWGDFGLVDFPENINDFTRSDKGLGAIFTIAPEMKRDPKHADCKKADVFSFAKTLWMFLTLDEKGFDGVYNYADASMGLRFNSKYKESHLVELEELLTIATDNDPERRPTITEFINYLKIYLEVWLDVDKSQISDWKFLSKNLFGENEPRSTVWDRREKIVDVLNILGASPAYNHMLFSGMGGLDFAKAEIAPEQGCIYIYDTIGCCRLMKPSSLFYEGFSDNSKWNYFLLELSNLESIENHAGNDTFEYERLVEDKPGHYVSAKAAQYGVYDYDSSEPLPEGYKVVQRYVGGSILFVLKRGLYNAITATYDGRHGMCTSQQFRKYVELMIALEEKAKEQGINIENVMNQVFHKNPFEKEDDEADNREEKRRKHREVREYIKNTFMKWNFLDGVIKQNNLNPQIRFKFMFRVNSSMSSFFEKKQWQLCQNGFFCKVSDNDKNIFYVYDREEALKLYDMFVEKINAECAEQGMENDELSYDIEITFEKEGKPSHLFTKAELYQALYAADDREDNMLVINEDGYINIIQKISEGVLYPVRHETWGAGNVFVGKYADLSNYQEIYEQLLYAWRDYLKSGCSIFIDYYRAIEETEAELIGEIRKYM